MKKTGKTTWYKRAMPGVILCAALAASACEKREDRIAFDGQFYRASASKVGDDRAQFQISVAPVSASLDGAREAGRYESTRYCIENYGISAVDWEIGPDQEPETYVIANDTLVLRGKCAE